VVSLCPSPEAASHPGPLAGRAASGYNFWVPHVLPTLRVKVLFFGRVRELTGIVEEAVEMPEGATLADLFERYAIRFPQLAGFRASLVASRNQEFVPWDTRLSPEDDIAFLPPVSGG
jgi:molybdopterin synthase sulfur carrier subunit